MAKMIPYNLDDGTISHAEREIFYQLRSIFNEEVVVYHSYDVLARNRENRIIDAEIDYLILHPQYGILILEVKGGVISYTEGIWYQNSVQLHLDPEKQARLNKFDIKNYLTKRLGVEPPISFGHAVCFPDHFGEPSELPGNIDNIAVTGNHIEYLEDYIISIMKQFAVSGFPICDEKMFTIIRRALIPVFEYGSSLEDKIGQEKRVLHQLTDEQCDLLDVISLHKKVLIQGCTGSGKTIMAVKKAKQLACEGLDVLLMCYNNLLADYLKESISGLEDRITASTYHQFCISTLEKAGVTLKHAHNYDNFWTEYIPNEFARSIENVPVKYDAIIIDEAQDFKEEYWISITDLLNENGYYYIFCDPGQNLYDTRLQLPDLGEPFILSNNCRNTRSIFEAVKEHSLLKMSMKNNLPKGEDIHIFKSASPQMRRKEIGKILHDLVVNQSLDESQIVLLGGHSIQNTCLAGEEKTGRFEIEENGRAGKYTIPYYTYMKFKGCDSDAVILVDVDDSDPRWNTDKAIYTAYSRAKHILYIIKNSQPA